MWTRKEIRLGSLRKVARQIAVPTRLEDLAAFLSPIMELEIEALSILSY
jgi:hypothetical protein